MELLKSRLMRFENHTAVNYVEIAGDSSEAKPTTNIVDGSTFTETDTGDVYMFNGKTATWIKQFSLQG